MHPPTHPSTHLFPPVNCHPSSPPSILPFSHPSKQPSSIIHQSIYLPSIHSHLLASFFIPSTHPLTHSPILPSIHPPTNHFIHFSPRHLCCLEQSGKGRQVPASWPLLSGMDGWMDALRPASGVLPSLETPFLAPACSSLLLLFLLCTPYPYMPASH